MVSPLLGHELDSLLLLLSSSPAQLQISPTLVPVPLLPHGKHGSQPQQVDGTTATAASSSSLHHCAFPEDGGDLGSARGAPRNGAVTMPCHAGICLESA